MGKEDKTKKLLSLFPLYSEELRIDLSQPQGRFEWFLAGILFGARISEQIAANTYRCFKNSGLDTPDKILAAGWDKLVEVLDFGGYIRYDFSTATKLLGIMNELKAKYGSLEGVFQQSSGSAQLMRHLQEFKDIGPATQIFLRELHGIWGIECPVSTIAKDVAMKLNINLDDFKGNELAVSRQSWLRLI